MNPNPLWSESTECATRIRSAPPEYGQQWLEGEQASFDENPDACPYRIGSTEAFWWQQGFDAAEAVTAALSEDSEN